MDSNFSWLILSVAMIFLSGFILGRGSVKTKTIERPEPKGNPPTCRPNNYSGYQPLPSCEKGKGNPPKQP
jgi:hypothetical protein